MSCLTQFKMSSKKTIIILSAFTLVLSTVNSAIYNFGGIDFSNRLYPLIVSIPAFLCFCLLSKTKGIKVLFSFLTVCNFGMLASFIGFISLIIFHSPNFQMLFEVLCFVIIFVLILKYFRKPYLKIFDTLDKGWGLLCCAPSLLTVIIYMMLYYPIQIDSRPEYMPITFLVFALMFVFYAVVYYNFENISEFYQFKYDREVVLIQTDMQKKEYNAIVDKIETVQLYRHDMRHHINVINTFLKDNNISEAKKYFSKLNDNLNDTIVEKYCENYMLNVILSSYISQARNEGITVICEVKLSENVKIDNIELGLIFTNAIENAIIACKKIENPDDRKINIVCKGHYNQLYIQISNTFIGNVLFNGEYPVSNEEDHGFGTRSIAAISEKYGGVFSFRAKDGIFKTTVIMNI